MQLATQLPLGILRSWDLETVSGRLTGIQQEVLRRMMERERNLL